MTQTFASWHALYTHLFNIAGVRASPMRGICIRRKDAEYICILRSVDGTFYYNDTLVDPPGIVTYTFAGRKNGQNRAESQNAHLEHGTGRIFLYRVHGDAPARTWIYYGEYRREPDSVVAQEWTDIDHNMRTIYTIRLIPQ